MCGSCLQLLTHHWAMPRFFIPSGSFISLFLGSFEELAIFHQWATFCFPADIRLKALLFLAHNIFDAVQTFSFFYLVGVLSSCAQLGMEHTMHSHELALMSVFFRFGQVRLLVLFILPLLSMKGLHIARTNVMPMSEQNTRVRCINESLSCSSLAYSLMSSAHVEELADNGTTFHHVSIGTLVQQSAQRVEVDT